MVKTLTISVKDDKNRVSKFSVNFPPESSNAGIQTWMNDFLDITDTLIKGAVVSAHLTTELPINPTLKQIPDITADVEERLIAGFRTQANYRTSITLATFNDAYTVPLVASKERSPDFLDADVTAWFNMFTAAGLNGYEPPADKRGDLIERIDKSRYKHRK